MHHILKKHIISVLRAFLKTRKLIDIPHFVFNKSENMRYNFKSNDFSLYGNILVLESYLIIHKKYNI